MMLFFLSNQFGGFRLFIVSSASMEPAIPTGSLLLTRYINPKELQIGDIITFIPPINNTEFVTHRITTTTHQENLSTFITKGDNNPNEDLWILAGGGIVGKVIFAIPLLGYFFSFTQSKIGIIFLILLPAVYIIVDEITKITKLIKNRHFSSNKRPNESF